MRRLVDPAAADTELDRDAAFQSVLPPLSLPLPSSLTMIWDSESESQPRVALALFDAVPLAEGADEVRSVFWEAAPSPRNSRSRRTISAASGTVLSRSISASDMYFFVAGEIQ